MLPWYIVVASFYNFILFVSKQGLQDLYTYYVIVLLRKSQT